MLKPFQFSKLEFQSDSHSFSGINYDFRSVGFGGGHFRRSWEARLIQTKIKFNLYPILMFLCYSFLETESVNSDNSESSVMPG